MLRVAFAGLPSAGKSTMINALAGARFLETGVCRTTRAPCVLSAEDPGKLGVKCDWKKANMRSDDGVSLCVVDLPGICDAENTGSESNFTDLTMQWTAHCDVIVWVTDVRTCFLTSHEKQEYEKLKDALERIAITTGRLFQFCVVLAKCDVDIVGAASAARSAVGAAAKRVVAGEIVSVHEETTVSDCFDRAKRMFPSDRIVPFNAFGRILTRESSDALRALARQLAPNSTKVNTELNMQWATTDLHEKRQAQMLRSIVAALTGGAGNSTNSTNKDGLPEGWTTGLDMANKMRYYVNIKTGHTQLERPQVTASVSSSSAKLNRELVDGPNGLDESTTAMLMLLVLGVDDVKNHGTWHPIVAAAGQSAKGLVSKHAEVIGLLKHGPSAAQKYEATIKKRFECKYDQDKSVSALVEAMMHMCGANCVVTARMYFKLPVLARVLTPPSAMKAVPTGAPYYPAMLALDVEHNENRALGMSVSWVAKVKEARVKLWGDAERDVCVTTVLALVREKLLHSVLAPPIGI